MNVSGTGKATRGLYYTWLDASRTHGLFFNYKPATYLLVATKVAHIGVTASVSKRRGPQPTQTRSWNEEAGDWVVQAVADEPKRRVHGGYTKKLARVIPFKSKRRNGAGGGNRTHGLGIMRPSLFH